MSIKYYSITSKPLNDLGIDIPNWRNILSTEWTTPMLYKDSYYSCVECAYQAQKLSFVDIDDIELYKNMFEFDKEHGIDVKKAKWLGSIHGFKDLQLGLNSKKWNCHKFNIMFDIMKKRYDTDIEFKYIVDVVNYRQIRLICTDKSNYWTGRLTNDGYIHGANSLGNIIYKLNSTI